MSYFQGKTVWLTGASSGIGLAMAQQLAHAGAHLILTSRRQDALEQVRQSLAHPERHQVLALDLSQPEQAAAQAKEILGDQVIDILINNAGVSQRSLILETDMKVYRQLMEIDYFGVIALTKLVLPRMVERRSGQIVTVSSVAGKVGTKLRSGYNGAKFGVIGFMDSLRAEMAQYGLTVTSILPGFINTQVAHNSLTGDGSVLGHEDPDNAGGISAEECARKSLEAIAKQKAEVVVGSGLSKLAPFLQRFFPALVRRMIANR
ncbi:short chain dehydrogenase [Pseudidiomarina tainanensis]|jgi:short-subunit dehydrogenase|uniref:Short-chain dehydrogenase n=2 Tax=Pseudidiomarina TaxID=2800384 RepID=A0A1I6G5B0_9GAMM|nr:MULTISPECIES: SDR family oxidoreductase [Pseudidiomarina]RZQ57152.1 short chain dehydrogenase [Pseudidiomarina tainanensis]SFR37227.1 Short-chain dehydrogenase [Pseudidiomarina maritima]